MCEFISGLFYFVPLIFVSVFVLLPYGLMTSLWYSLKSGSVIFLVLFFLKIFLVIQGLLYFHIHLKNISSSSMKNDTGSLKGLH